MTVEAWLQAAVGDASSRGLADIEPILKTLAQATRVLRAADFNDRANGVDGAPPASSPAQEP
jgi:hypothetical protein